MRSEIRVLPDPPVSRDMKKFALVFFTLLSFFTISHENWTPTKLSEEVAHAPSVLPDRVVLTWNNNPATTQSVTWRTDTSVIAGLAEIAIANANGRALKTSEYKATTTFLRAISMKPITIMLLSQILSQILFMHTVLVMAKTGPNTTTSKLPA